MADFNTMRQTLVAFLIKLCNGVWQMIAIYMIAVSYFGNSVWQMIVTSFTTLSYIGTGWCWSNRVKLDDAIDRVVRDGYAVANLMETKHDKTMILVDPVYALRDGPESWRNNREIVLAAVQQDGTALEYASDIHKNDKDIVLVAVQNTGSGLKYAAEALKDDEEFILEAITKDRCAFRYASERLKGDNDFVLAAIQKDGRALEYAAEALRDDFSTVRKAVENDGEALEHASKRLRRDRLIVRYAIRNTGRALLWASNSLRNDKETVLTAIQEYGMAIIFASRGLRDDPEILGRAIANNSIYFNAGINEYCGENLHQRITRACNILKARGMLTATKVPFANVKATTDYVTKWKKSIYERLWLLLEQAPTTPLPTEIRQRIVQYSMPLLTEEYQQACELAYCAPVIGELSRFKPGSCPFL